MGHDVIASRSPDDTSLLLEDLMAFESEEIELDEWFIFDDSASFQGKRYNNLCLEIIGESLHEEWIPPEKILKMYQALEEIDEEQALQDLPRLENYQAKDIVELRKFFRVCAERGLGLVNSW